MENLIDMELSAAEAKEETSPSADAPKYPWGLCFELNEDTLKKLGLDKLPDVGAPMHIIAKAEVSSVSSGQYQGGETYKNLSLQITDMSVSEAPKDMASLLYDK